MKLFLVSLVCACLLVGCSQERTTNVADLLDNVSVAARDAGAIGVAFVETQNGAVYERVEFGIKPPVRAWGFVIYDYRRPKTD